MTASDALRELPSVQGLLEHTRDRISKYPHGLCVRAARTVIDDARQAILSGHQAPDVAVLEEQLICALTSYESASLRRVINATGVVLHTNLGRAPLTDAGAFTGYSNLEYDLVTGRRGKRDTHVQPLFEALLGRPAVAVNNGAAATFLALHELAAGYEVLLSRGELIEIGDGFRIPDILARSGAILREVGTTNRTRLEDYRQAINDQTRLIMRVHPSNFHITGFTAKPELKELAALARERGIPLYEDLGSGNVVDLRPYGIREPLVSESLDAGVNLVSFSGDKLLGGPQAGILAGDPVLVSRMRQNPLFRALRLDKMIYQTLECTLRNILLERWHRIPAFCMIRPTAEEVGTRARILLPDAELIPGESMVGGGSTPDQTIPTTLIVAASRNVREAEAALRARSMPVIARISDERVLVDLRTVFPEEEQELRSALLEIRKLP